MPNLSALTTGSECCLKTRRRGSSLGVTFKFALISLPIGMVLSFSLAMLLNSKDLIGRNVFRTLFYAPTMVPGIAAILIWTQVLNPNTGWMNRIYRGIRHHAVGQNGSALAG